MQQPHPIVARVLRALAVNRRPGASFAGDLLDVKYELAGSGSRAVLEPARHYADDRGEIDTLLFGAFIDLALAHAIRSRFDHVGNMPTSNIHLRFTGRRCVGPVVATGVFDGVSQGTTSPVGASHITLSGADGVIGTASGYFTAIATGPIPIRFGGSAEEQALAVAELDVRERAILDRVEHALHRSAKSGRAFITEFWDIVRQTTDTGATTVIESGVHVENLIGDLQGGLQLGIAQETAETALGAEWLMTSLNACYLRGGSGPRFVTTSEFVHRGRTTAVLRTRLCDAAGKTVLEVNTTHARRANPQSRMRAID